MDESWRMRMGMATAPPQATRPTPPSYHSRRSTEDASHRRENPVSLTPEDFSDVFGGPPRTILSRQFFTDVQRSPSSSTNFLYQELFRPTEKAPKIPVGMSGRSASDLRMPCQRNNEFFSDIFGWEDHERVVTSKSRSKASSSSVMSSGEISPLRPAVSLDGDDDVSYFGSKYRPPVNVKSRWTSRRIAHEEDPQKIIPPFTFTQYNTEKIYPDNLKSYAFGLGRRNTSPDTTRLERMSNGSSRTSGDDFELNSPSSVVSCQSSSQELTMEDEISGKEAAMDEDEEDEVMSSYVIEIKSDNRERTFESNGVEEAIAWAKEKFRTSESNKQEHEMKSPNAEMSKGHQVFAHRYSNSFRSSDEQQYNRTAEEITQFEYNVEAETQKLDEKLRLWSTGEKANIRLLLSSLHQILWPNSGWSAIPLSNLTDDSQVKKAYQKARLCLHPDKLQQRGAATISQEYIANKVFCILQDGWTTFVEQAAL